MAPSLSQTSAVSNTSSAGLGAPTGLGIAGMTGTSNLSSTSMPGISGFGTPGASTLGVSPMADLNFASPSTYPVMDLGTPSMLDRAGISSVNGLGGHSMNMSLSDLGMGSTRPKIDDDEQRRQRLRAILSRLRRLDETTVNDQHSTLANLGRISDEGIRRAGRWAGFDVEVEAKYENKQFEGKRPIVIAGRNAILIDVKLDDNTAQSVQVSFSSEQPVVSAHEPAASDVLLKNLKPARGQAGINSSLDAFAANLVTLARVDRLSTGGLSCIEAITGIHTSLCRLYEHEKAIARALFPANSESHKTEMHVLRSGCGKPSMHTASRIGLRLDYFADPLVLGQPGSTDHRMTGPENIHQGQSVNDEIHFLDLTIEPTEQNLRTPIRNCPDWLEPLTERPIDVDTPTNLPAWLDPPPTYILAPDDPMSAIDTTSAPAQQLPAVNFVAKLYPSVVMPVSVATALHQSVNAIMISADAPRDYTALVVSHNTDSVTRNTDLVATESCDMRALNGQLAGNMLKYTCSLYDPTPQAALALSSFPFEHPRQVLVALPVLRQWACIGSLLSSAFQAPSTNAELDTDIFKPSANSTWGAAQSASQFSLDDLLNPQSGMKNNMLAIDVVLVCLPVPTLTLSFPLDDSKAAHVSVEITANAEITVRSQTLVQREESDPDRMAREEARMAKALSTCLDICIWVEWLRSKYG